MNKILSFCADEILKRDNIIEKCSFINRKNKARLSIKKSDVIANDTLISDYKVGKNLPAEIRLTEDKGEIVQKVKSIRESLIGLFGDKIK